ncbi:MAG: hypothetical protein IJC53_01590 [Clostridia bacterium]|nr:hypothetical protein [Clostridia bacterium]
MEKRKSLGAWLEQQEQKNPLRFKTYYPAFVMEFSFLAVILAFALARLVTGGFDALNRGLGWLEPLEMLISCLLHPLILAILHYKDCRKNGVYIFFKSLGRITIPSLLLTLCVGLNDVLVTALLTSQGASFSWKMTALLLGATVLVLFILGLLCQMILIFARARNE